MQKKDMIDKRDICFEDFKKYKKMLSGEEKEQTQEGK